MCMRAAQRQLEQKHHWQQQRQRQRQAALHFMQAQIHGLWCATGLQGFAFTGSWRAAGLQGFARCIHYLRHWDIQSHINSRYV